MRIRMFHAGDGDCLLITSARTDRRGSEREHHMLVDGGRKTAFRENARDAVYAVPQLDLVYVSHIDDDHISGALGIIEDAVRWKVYERRLEKGQRAAQPSFPKPPPIREIWHNSLFELAGDELEPVIPGALTSSAGLLAGAPLEAARGLAQQLDNLASGERSSMELSRRISGRQLNIRRNRPRNQLMHQGNSRYRRVGPFTMRILAPTDEAITNLRRAWATWISENRDALRRLQAEMLDDEHQMGTLDATRVTQPLLESSLGAGSITPPNIASLMLLLNDRDSTVLLPGDGSSEDLLDGLAHYNRLDDAGRLHVSALKVQHHGALANVTEDFVDRITADHYLFCGNGAHHNPELEVVDAFAKARLGIDRGPIWPNRDFHFWFSSRHDSPGLSDARISHMHEVEQLVTQIKREHDQNDRFHFTFVDRGHHDILI